MIDFNTVLLVISAGAIGVSLVAFALGMASLGYRTKEKSDLNAEIKRLSAHQDALVCALELMLERCPEPPDPNCSCFISPPCNDCVEHAGEREAFEFARAQLAKLGAAS